MELKLKSDIYDSDIKSNPNCINDYDYIAGYFADIDIIIDNDDFLEVYRHVQFFGLSITDDMRRFASIPNYAPHSIIENMRLTGEDTYFNIMKQFFENNDNIYMPIQTMDIIGNEYGYHQLVEFGRADLTQKYYDEGYPPEDIYSNITTANTTLEVIKTLMKNNYVPSDDIICWYFMKGMGGIAKQCITEYSDLPFIIDCEPADLDSFNFIESRRSEPYDTSDIISLLYNIVSISTSTDVALFRLLYERITKDLTLTEKFDIMKRILVKNEKFLIYTYMKILKNEGFSNSQLENQVFYISKSYTGYIIFKVQIENCKDLDVIADMCYDLTSSEKIDFYNEDENGFISAQNEKYANSSDSDSSYYESDEDEDEEENDDYEEDLKYGDSRW